MKVTLAPATDLDTPVIIDGSVALEPGSPVVWFTFPGLWHDIGRFHRADGEYTGIYANILTPPSIDAAGGVWKTTDLYLDIWVPPDGNLRLLDENQLQEAAERGWISREAATRARQEAERIRERRERGTWPPPVVEEWDLRRAWTARGASPGSSG